MSQVANSIKGWTIKISVSDCSLISIAENFVTLLIILKTEPHVFRSEFFLIQRHKTVGQGASWSLISEISESKGKLAHSIILAFWRSILISHIVDSIISQLLLIIILNKLKII